MSRLVLSGVPVHTITSNAVAEAVAVADGKILAVGDRPAVLAAAGPEATELRLERGALLPGFVDAHHHAYLVVTDPSTDALYRKAADIPGMLEVVGGLRNLPATWLRLHGYEPLDLSEMRSPTAAEIDAVVADRPVHLISRTFHESAVNTLGLEQLGFDRSERRPPGVLVGRRGRPTGVLVEQASFAAEAASRPAARPELDRGRLAWHAERLFAAGITTICDAAVPIADADAYVEAADTLGLRVAPLLVGDRIDAPGLRAGSTAKVLADGGEYCHLCLTGRQVAALSASSLRATLARNGRLARAVGRRAGFPTHAGHGQFRTGITLTGTEELRTLLGQAANIGSRLAVHAIGNGALHSVLDARQSAVAGNEVGLRVEHSMVLDGRDADSLAGAGIPVVAQPGFLAAFGHQLNAVPLPAPLRLMPFAGLLRAGTTIAFSSDHPAADLNPWTGIASAVTRADRFGRAILGDESISVRAAIKAYTTSAANLLGINVGRIEPGAPADLVWVHPDPFTCPADCLAATATLLTWSNGTVRYASADSGFKGPSS
jgi:hypothetical protein